jgi:hypothetical protein
MYLQPCTRHVESLGDPWAACMPQYAYISLPSHWSKQPHVCLRFVSKGLNVAA